MEKITSFLNNRNIRNFIFFSFSVHLIFLANDFGISYDEFWYRDVGFSVLTFLGKIFFPEKLLEITLVKNLEYPSLEQILNVAPIGIKIQHTIYSALEYFFFSNAEKYEVFKMRHTLNIAMSCFAFLIFYRILRLQFSKIFSTLGLIMLILSPKIFSDYYYNPNDIWALFAAGMITYFSLYFFKKNKYKYFYFLSFLFAFGLNTRLILIYLYLIFLFFYLIKNKIFFEKKSLTKIFFQFFLFIVFLYILSPNLWVDLPSFFSILIKQLTFSQDSMIYFNDTFLRSSQLPKYYTILWIFLSTPTFYLVTFFIGLTKYFLNIKDNKLKNQNIYSSFFFLYLFIPILAIIIFKPNLFNGWRHFYFLNLALVYFSIFGIKFIFDKFKSKIIYCIFSFFIFLNFLNIGYWMISNHPYQHIFFNSLAKKHYNKFDLDYWGLSNFEALKYIGNVSLKLDKTVKVKALGESRIIYAYKILDKGLKEKILILPRDGLYNADYYITNFHDGKDKEYYLSKGFKIINEIKVDNIVINAVMKKK